MAPISKPFVFYAGEKAKANEVNENFDIVYNGVNELDRQVTDLNTNILEVNEGKADINGNAQQTFQVADGTSAYEAVNKGQLDKVLPVGSIIMVTHDKDVYGFYECNGANLSRTSYKALYDVIGTTYGSGDGTNTFTLPNFTNRAPWGTTASGGFGYISAGLPDIIGSFTSQDGRANGAFHVGGRIGGLDGGGVISNWVDFKASWTTNTDIYGKSNTVQPPAIRVRFLIKYI